MKKSSVMMLGVLVITLFCCEQVMAQHHGMMHGGYGWDSPQGQY